MEAKILLNNSLRTFILSYYSDDEHDIDDLLVNSKIFDVPSLDQIFDVLIEIEQIV